MAVYTPKRLAQAQLTAADATYYTVPAGTSAIIKEIVVCNTNPNVQFIYISLCASGATVGDSNRVINSASVNTNTTVIYTLNQVLAAGGFVSAKTGTATAVTITISGVEFL